MQTAATLQGTTVYDRFGAWELDRDEDGNWIAIQGQTEVLIQDRADCDRFGIEIDIWRVA